ncbi:ABC-2 family transporter protein [Patescibacteria group bacterium]
MDKITNLTRIEQKNSDDKSLKTFFYKTGNFLEILIILGIWVLIFKKAQILGDYTREEIITYIIFGNLLGVFSAYFMRRIIAADLIKTDSKILIYKPFRYFNYIISEGIKKFLAPFLITSLFYLVVVFVFINEIIINFNILYLTVIFLLVILNFIIEFLLAYLINLFVFWTIESKDAYAFIVRIKRLLAGNYFPLDFLLPVFVSISLVFPFAYGFFVPMQIYLKKMTLTTGWVGAYIQLIWIIFLYLLIKIVWSKKHPLKNKVNPTYDKT